MLFESAAASESIIAMVHYVKWIPLYLLLILAAGLGLAEATTPVGPVPGQATVIVLDIDGPIGPATSDYVTRGLERAAQQGSSLVVLRMDTPGGLDSAMRDIIKHIMASPVPVASFVAPSGARAASAGTYILYASHVAAMAPGTNLGAATPVQIGGLGGEPERQDSKSKSGGSTMQHKLVNDAVAYIRGLATLRGRNANWAEKAVREAASLPADQALKLHVVDLIADNVPDLLHKLEGRKVNVMGQVRTLHTAGLAIETLKPDWRTRLLGVITNPNVAYILMLIGIYGLILEFSNPGAILPGAVGAICLLLALFAFQALPINYAGFGLLLLGIYGLILEFSNPGAILPGAVGAICLLLALFAFQALPINYAGFGLLLLGIALMVAEAFAPSFGALGISGVIAFAIGSVILIDTQAPGFGISPALIGAFTLVSAALFILVLGMVFRARRRPVVSGEEELIGAVGVALSDFDASGTIRVHSELWSALSNTPIRRGQKVRVTGREGLTLTVTPNTPPREEKR